MKKGGPEAASCSLLSGVHGEPAPHVARLFQLQRKDLGTIAPLGVLIEGVGFILAVVVELPRVGGTAYFRGHAQHIAHALMHGLEGAHYALGHFRAKSEGIDEGGRHAALVLPAVLFRVEHIAEHEAVQEAEQFRRDIVVIDGRAEDEGVRPCHEFEDGRKLVLHGAEAMPAALALAGKTAHASFEFKRIEMHELCFRPSGGGPVQRGLKHGGGIALETRTAVERKYHMTSRCWCFRRRTLHKGTPAPPLAQARLPKGRPLATLAP